MIFEMAKGVKYSALVIEWKPVKVGCSLGRYVAGYPTSRERILSLKDAMIINEEAFSP